MFRFNYEIKKRVITYTHPSGNFVPKLRYLMVQEQGNSYILVYMYKKCMCS